MLTKNKTLTKMKLRDNMIDDEGVKDIANALKANSSLTVLHLGFI